MRGNKRRTNTKEDSRCRKRNKERDEGMGREKELINAKHE